MNGRHSISCVILPMVVALLLVGCEGSTESSGPSEMDRMAEMLNQPKEQPPEKKSSAVEDSPAETSATASADDEGEDMSQARAVTVHDAKRGKKTRATGGYMGAVLYSRFYAEHKMEYIKVFEALKLYNAEKGHYPRNHREFVKEIIEPNYIHLPELDEGMEYIFDPSERDLEQMLKIRPVDDETAEAESVVPGT